MNKIVEIRHDSQYAISDNDISSINTMDQPIIENMIQSNKIFTPQEYLKLITGDDYTIPDVVNDLETTASLRFVIFWIIWGMVIICIVYFFVCLDNKWLN